MPPLNSGSNTRLLLQPQGDKSIFNSNASSHDKDSDGRSARIMSTPMFFGDSCLSDLAKRHNMRIVAVGSEPFLDCFKGVGKIYYLTTELVKKWEEGLDRTWLNFKLKVPYVIGISGDYVYFIRVKNPREVPFKQVPDFYKKCVNPNKKIYEYDAELEKIGKRKWRNRGHAVIGKGSKRGKSAGSGPKREGIADCGGAFPTVANDCPKSRNLRAGQPSQPQDERIEGPYIATIRAREAPHSVSFAGISFPKKGPQSHALTKVGRRGKGGSGILHFRSNLHGPAHVSAIGKLWVLNSSGKRFTVCTNGGEIIQRDTLEEALGVLVESVLEEGGDEGG